MACVFGESSELWATRLVSQIKIATSKEELLGSFSSRLEYSMRSFDKSVTFLAEKKQIWHFWGREKVRPLFRIRTVKGTRMTVSKATFYKHMGFQALSSGEVHCWGSMAYVNPVDSITRLLLFIYKEERKRGWF